MRFASCCLVANWAGFFVAFGPVGCKGHDADSEP